MPCRHPARFQARGEEPLRARELGLCTFSAQPPRCLPREGQQVPRASRDGTPSLFAPRFNLASEDRHPRSGWGPRFLPRDAPAQPGLGGRGDAPRSGRRGTRREGGVGDLGRCLPPAAEPQGRARGRGCHRRLPPRLLAGAGRPLVRAGLQGPGGPGGRLGLPPPRSAAPPAGARPRCCPGVLSLRYRAPGAASQNVRQPRGKSNPLKEGETPL